MRLAIIDLGTNSLRLDIYQVARSSYINRLHREKIMVRLGDSLYKKMILQKKAMVRTLMAFKEFNAVLDDLKVDKVIAFATSALRDAKNKNHFIQLIKEKTGIGIKVIPGYQEARLIAEGVLKNEQIPKDLFALVDIGGGSTEVIFCQGRKILHSKSYDLGANRLKQLFLKSHPPKTSDILVLRESIREKIYPSTPIPQFIGSSGTIRAIHKILKKAGCSVNPFLREDLSCLIEDMIPMSLKDLLRIPGMEKKRADILLSGALLLEELMFLFNTEKVFVTEYSLRDGIFISVIKNIRSL